MKNLLLLNASFCCTRSYVVTLAYAVPASQFKSASIPLHSVLDNIISLLTDRHLRRLDKMLSSSQKRYYPLIPLSQNLVIHYTIVPNTPSKSLAKKMLLKKHHCRKGKLKTLQKLFGFLSALPELLGCWTKKITVRKQLYYSAKEEMTLKKPPNI